MAVTPASSFKNLFIFSILLASFFFASLEIQKHGLQQA
jgi:hypothetical protein